MLVDFQVENFRSIKHPVNLSAVAQKSRTQSGQDTKRKIKSDNDIAFPSPIKGWNFEVLPVLAIFGANASGKSNVVNALNVLIDAMASDTYISSSPLKNFSPFLLDAASRQKPTRFSVRLTVSGEIYTYTLALDTKRILHETLSYSPAATKKDRLLYDRRWDDTANRYSWKNGDHFAGPYKQFEASISNHNTFLSLLMNLEIPMLASLKFWLRNHIVGVGHEYEQIDELGAILTSLEDKDHLGKIAEIVRLFDTGVARFEVLKTNADEANASAYKIRTLHQTEAGEYWFPFQLESAGTCRLFGLANNILKSFQAGSLMIVDELGANLHPNISHSIVRMFQNPRMNTKGTQLIFTSHDNTLQSNQLLRRDQIWFTQKRTDGSTKLYPLSDFKPRNDLAIDKSYIDGRYGAVPILPDEEELASILAGDVNAIKTPEPL